MKISQAMEKVVNKQIQDEFESAYLYLSMAAWFESRDLSGFARWLKAQYHEELSHGQKMFEYLVERDGQPIVPGIKEPKREWKSPLDAFEAVYAHEQFITACIYKVVKAARDDGDIASEVYFNYFVKEQVEEEATSLGILKTLRLMGDNVQGLFILNQKLGERA